MIERRKQSIEHTEDSFIDTKRKALEINLAPPIYGTIAEIGAGQEVARAFFRAGAAAGTIAKSMSAYDMTFSDEIYGKEDSGRYVCESRLHKMLKHEYQLIIERLADNRPGESTFFSFANTVAAKAYQRKSECHGWLGVKFQSEPHGEPNEVVMHVRMLDSQNIMQQQALGIVGVNLIYACFFHHNDPERFVTSLMDNLNSRRIEIDMLKVSGPNMSHFDNRLLSLWLVSHGMAQAVMFDKKAQVIQASEALYKKNIFVLRGSFRPPTHVNLNMLEAGYQQFLREANVDPERSVALTEITTTNLQADGELCEKDFLARIDLLAALGQNVLLSNYHEYYRLSHYFARFTKNMIVMALGVNNLQALFDESYYQKLPGGILQAFGELFSRAVKLYVYPMQEPGEKTLYNCENVQITDNLKHLYAHLRDNGYINDYEAYDDEVLSIFSREVLSMIKKNKAGWEPMVPSSVEKTIKKKCLFGYTGGHCDLNSMNQKAS